MRTLMRYFPSYSLFVVLGALNSSALADSAREINSGEVWQVMGGAYEGVEISICKIEQHNDLGRIMHVSIEKPFEIVGVGVIDGISHLPFSASAIAMSDIELQAIPARCTNFQQGYEEWKEANLNSGAGIWTLTVSAALDAMLQAIQDSDAQ